MTSMDEVKKKTDALHKICLEKGMLYYPEGRWPSKMGDHGDDCLWLGILASQGIPLSFEGLIGCQDLQTGQFWRSPERRRVKNKDYTNAHFSRDMAMGVMLGFSRSGFDHIEHFLRPWINFIMTRNTSVPMYKLADGSDTCLIVTPVIWGLLEKLFRAKGCSTSSQMRRWKGYDDTGEFVTVRTVDLGYELHLHALGAYLRLILGSNKKRALQIARKCYERSPNNFFYKILAQNCVAKDEDLLTFLEICPDPETFQQQSYWTWEQRFPEQHYQRCCGWDFVFLGNLLTKGI